jgi:hypothetical protein
MYEKTTFLELIYKTFQHFASMGLDAKRLRPENKLQQL